LAAGVADGLHEPSSIGRAALLGAHIAPAGDATCGRAVDSVIGEDRSNRWGRLLEKLDLDSDGQPSGSNVKEMGGGIAR
jgi:hypothetical protein